MARLIWGIIITTFYGIMLVVKLVNNDTKGIFFLFLLVSVGVLLIIYGIKYIKQRKIIVTNILKNLIETNGIDLDKISNTYSLPEDKIKKILLYIQKKGILHTYCKKCKKEFPIESIESFISIKSKDDKSWKCPECTISMDLERGVYQSKVLLKIGGVTVLVGFIHLIIGLGETGAGQGSYRFEVSPFFIVLGIILIILGATIKSYRCLNCNTKIDKNVLVCPVCGTKYDN